MSKEAELNYEELYANAEDSLAEILLIITSYQHSDEWSKSEICSLIEAELVGYDRFQKKLKNPV